MDPGVDESWVSSDPALLGQNKIELLLQEMDQLGVAQLIVDVVSKPRGVDDRQQQLRVVLVQNLHRRFCDGYAGLLVGVFRVKHLLVLGRIVHNTAQVRKSDRLTSHLTPTGLAVLVPMWKNVAIQQRVDERGLSRSRTPAHHHGEPDSSLQVLLASKDGR
ncbi:hypothetical protein OGAPHI_002471 [Ogataea philodendri]|uniref:Uncharacterized protein n=1 Tax=Ogataea philodendri TaxID=1378263 RepID=A0A9P8PB35_9ASCO|nr:uncharacterized protein OGAPHI_002471 [Ogataea philodendri]KAH3668717.1 hypothetical protein OGAPHI_002471 [Ogataea philodendri]